MSRRRRASAIGGLLAALLMTVTSCGASKDTGGGTGPGAGANPPAASEDAGALPFDVRPLLKPEKKYLGAAVHGAPTSMEPIDGFAEMIGKKPNLVEYYAGWGDGFNAGGVRNAWEDGALTVMSWEPFDVTLADIAAGETDAYLKKYAQAVRKLNLPVAISFADEMNGAWEKWGTKNTTPEEYVAAWRHIHKIFLDAGTANVIWTWAPNIVNPMKDIDIKAYYPGDAYVDWVGMVGYFTENEDNAYDSVFGPTVTKIRTFSEKPLLILETAAAPGPRRREDVRNLFAGMEADESIVGFVWFDYKKRADWRLSVSPLALEEFKELVAGDQYGFDVRKTA